MSERINILEAPSWMLQPTDKIVPAICAELANEPVFKEMFGEAIEPYMRGDFSVRDLPALRVFDPNGRKDAETWYSEGIIRAEVIFPPSIRRAELQAYPALVRSALLAQFRRDSFFSAMRKQVPALNRLGWSFSWDNTLGFVARDADEVCPMVQITIDWRVDMAEWDRYLESDDRTTDEPFEKTIGDLKKIVAKANALLDDGTEAVVEIPATVTIEQ